MADIKIVNNASFMVNDLLQGDESVVGREDFSILSPSEIHEAFDLLLNNKYFSDDTKKTLITNMWKINYVDKPPTIEEFLTEEWLGETAKSLFPYIKESLYTLFSRESNIKNLILYMPIGSGKSFLVGLANLYIGTIVYLMRNPRKLFNQSAASPICNVFMAFSLGKAKETLLKPFTEIMSVSPKFERCRTIDQMHERELEYGSKKICWTTAGGMEDSVLIMGKNMSYKIKSSISSLLGLTILCGSVTELAFFKEAGYTDEDIMKLYNDLKGRIFSRFPNEFWAKSILDSSPNDATYQSSIDWWIENKADEQKDAKGQLINKVIRGKKWELQPKLFEIWNKDRTKVFWMFVGGKNGKIPKVLKTKEETLEYDERDIIECPIDAINIAEEDPPKFLKDYAGIPAGASNRLIHDNQLIENVFDKNIHSLYSHITALSTENPEGLIWNKIYKEFFIQIIPGSFEFYRNVQEERFVSVDQSVAGDTASIAVTHPELNLNGEIIDIVDMSINIIPNKARINLDAIKFIIHDLRAIGHLPIKHVSFDQFQSESAQQYLQRDGFAVEHLSVDEPITAYISFIQQVTLGRIKSGKNIYIKNNLKSLKMSKTKSGRPKVDHENGAVENALNANDNWDTSSLGYNAKDATDAICASIELRKKYFVGSPRYIYDPKIEKKCEVINGKTCYHILSKYDFHCK
jgi:hypothetical protein